jgi:hypothetical protein
MIRRLMLCFMVFAASGAALVAQTADMGGQWETVYNPPSGHVDCTLYITQTGTTLKGNAETEGGEFALTGTVDGNKFTLRFTRPSGGTMVTIVMTGTAQGDQLANATAQVANAAPVPLEGSRTSR